MHPYKIDIPVLLIFFIRHETLKKAWEQIKIARPSKLFLYQDGARTEKSDDVEGIKKCREIVEDIDWECEIHRFYQTENMGCDPSNYLAQKWMFSHVEEGIILEDDDVPSQSFFPFCKELLEKYEHDTRINYITGTNSLQNYDNGLEGDYFFSTGGSIWGWATWKRTIDQWDENMSFLDNEAILEMLKKVMGKDYFSYRKKIWEWHRQTGTYWYESILGSSLWMNSQLCIIPKKNLISNIGIGPNSVHATDTLQEVPKYWRHVFFSNTHELEFPLRHPQYVINDMDFFERINWQVFHGSTKLKIKRKIKKLIGKSF